MAIRVGRWDCPVCNTKGNLGPDKHCVSCGSPRPKNVKFYLANDSEIVQDEKRIQEAKSGADWVCSYCGAHNKALKTHCHSCGNDREADDGDESLKQKINYTDGRNDKKTSPPPPASQKKSPNKSSKAVTAKPKVSKKAKIGCLGAIGTAIFVFILTLFSSDIEVTVTDFEWQRSITMEKYAKVIEEDWRIPSGGEKISEYKAVHHYDKVPDGTETKTRTVKEKVGTERVKVGEKDLGNGYFEDVYEDRPVYETREETYEVTKYRKEPVYITKYKYSIYKWTKDGTYETGEKNKNPFWSEKAHLGNKNYREKKREEKYFVYVKTPDGEIHKEEVSLKKWETIKKSDKLQAEESSVFGTFKGLK